MIASSSELEILADRSFLQLKEAISKKIVKQLAEIENELKQVVKTSNFDFPTSAFTQSGKISKGENYRGLPYFILDYPRLFTKKETFAFRAMLWWGHEFSCTLHIGGEQLGLLDDHHIRKIHDAKDLYFCIENSPWEYHFESDNYCLMSELTLEEIKTHMAKNKFIKISRYIPVKAWDSYKSFTLESFARYLILLD